MAIDYQCSSHSSLLCKTGIETRFQLGLVGIGWVNMQIRDWNLLNCTCSFGSEECGWYRCNGEEKVKCRLRFLQLVKGFLKVDDFSSEDVCKFLFPYGLLTLLLKKTLLARIAFSILKSPFLHQELCLPSLYFFHYILLILYLFSSRK